MTHLNLHDKQRKSAEHKSWHVRVQTNTRVELIQLSIFLAQALRPSYFHDLKDIPIVLIHGSTAGGKSMMVEAMMKTLLDQCNPLDMIQSNAKKTMFIEKTPMEACDRYCYAAGSTDGIPVLYGFDRYSRSDKASLIDTFNDAAIKARPKPMGGAIFRSSRNKDRADPWIVLELKNEIWPKEWSKTTRIDINSAKLQSDPKFKVYWRRLNEAAESGDLSTLFSPLLAAPRSASLNFGVEYTNHRNVDPEASMLKLAFDKAAQLGFDKADIIQVAAKIADRGDPKAIAFLSWLRDRSENDAVSSVIEKTRQGTLLRQALAGEIEFPLDIIVNGYREKDRIKPLIQKMFSDQAILRNGSLYKSMHQAINENNRTRGQHILELAIDNLTNEGLNKFLTRQYGSKRNPEPSILQRLYETKNFALLDMAASTVDAEQNSELAARISQIKDILAPFRPPELPRYQEIIFANQ